MAGLFVTSPTGNMDPDDGDGRDAPQSEGESISNRVKPNSDQFVTDHLAPEESLPASGDGNRCITPGIASNPEPDGVTFSAAASLESSPSSNSAVSIPSITCTASTSTTANKFSSPKPFSPKLKAQELAPQKLEPRKLALQKLGPQKVAPQKLALQELAPQNLTSQHLASQKPSSQHSAPLKLTLQKIPPEKPAREQIAPQMLGPLKLASPEPTPRGPDTSASTIPAICTSQLPTVFAPAPLEKTLSQFSGATSRPAPGPTAGTGAKASSQPLPPGQKAHCERCGIEHDGQIGSGRFCSIRCARKKAAARKWEKQRAKVSEDAKEGKTPTTASGASRAPARNPVAKRQRTTPLGLVRPAPVAGRALHLPASVASLARGTSKPTTGFRGSPASVPGANGRSAFAEPMPRSMGPPIPQQRHSALSSTMGSLNSGAGRGATRGRVAVAPVPLRPVPQYYDSPSYSSFTPPYFQSPQAQVGLFAPSPGAVATPPPPPPPTPAPLQAGVNAQGLPLVVAAAHKFAPQAQVSSKRECQSVAEALLTLGTAPSPAPGMMRGMTPSPAPGFPRGMTPSPVPGLPRGMTPSPAPAPCVIISVPGGMSNGRTPSTGQHGTGQTGQS